MKPRRIQRWMGIATIALAITSLASRDAQSGQHELIWALNFPGDQLLSFRADNPGTILQSQSVVGLARGEQLQSISYWDGTIYGLGSQSRLYAINLETGQAESLGTGSGNSLLRGAAFGFAITPAGARVVSELDINLNFSRITGTASANPVLCYAPGDRFAGTSPNITSLAYDPYRDTLTGLDYFRKTLVGVDPNTGQVRTLAPGNLGIEFSRYNGFSISAASGVAYLGSPAGSSDPQADLYTVDLATAQVTLVGLIGNLGDGLLVRSLTVVPDVFESAARSEFGATTVPEPGAMTLVGIGVLGWLFCTSRRRG